MAIDHPDRRVPAISRLAVAAAFGLAASTPAMSARTMTIAMPLCSGGTVDLPLGRKGPPPDSPGACHAGCAVRRDGDGTVIRKTQR